MHTINEHKTAILIFALSSQEEIRCKNLHGAKELFKSLSRHTLNTVRKTGLPYFHLTEKDQKGATFGDRFTNAIQSIYEKGFERIVTIGNDSPHLKASHILKTANVLSKTKVVIGPSIDGGFYLMGLHKANFNTAVFKSLPWQTSGLMQQLASELSSNENEIVLLNPLHDIDNADDFKSILKFSGNLPYRIRRAVQSLLDEPKQFLRILVPNPDLVQIDNYKNKGSPLVPTIQEV